MLANGGWDLIQRLKGKKMCKIARSPLIYSYKNPASSFTEKITDTKNFGKEFPFETISIDLYHIASFL